MNDDDLSAVVTIERRTYHAPWPGWFFQKSLRGGRSCWVLLVDEEVIGYAIMEIRKNAAHIMNVCVTPERRRQGYGRGILNRLLEIARQHQCTIAWLEVRPSNQEAITLYHALGFRSTTRKRHYYPASFGREDAIVMSRSL